MGCEWKACLESGRVGTAGYVGPSHVHPSAMHCSSHSALQRALGEAGWGLRSRVLGVPRAISETIGQASLFFFCLLYFIFYC